MLLEQLTLPSGTLTILETVTISLESEAGYACHAAYSHALLTWSNSFVAQPLASTARKISANFLMLSI